MENHLKEKNSNLHFLTLHDNNPRVYEIMRKLITIYKTNDEVITEFIKELSNKIKIKKSLNLVNLINVANNRLLDGTNLIESFISSKNSSDLFFIINIIADRLNKYDHQEDLTLLINQILLDSDFKIMIDNAVNSEIDLPFFELTNLVKIVLASNNNELFPLVEKILCSNKINDLSSELIRSAVLFLSRNKKSSYEEILEDLIMNQITNLQILIDLKSDMFNSKNKKVQIKGGVTDIYDNYYTKYNGTKLPTKRKIIEKSSTLLKSYNDEVLKSFVDSLDSKYINKTQCNSSYSDVLSDMIIIDKPERAEDIFIKSSYKPIDKTKRKKVLNYNDNLIDEFSPRLNNNINLCLRKGYYDLLLTIISSKKIDSLFIDNLYYIVKEIEYCKKNYDEEEGKICQLILDTLLLKISEDKLMIYRISHLGYDYTRDNKHVLSKDGSLAFINEIISNPELEKEKIIINMNGKWISFKK